LKTSDFDIQLPREMVAQTPAEPRDHSRLLVLDKTTGEIQHKVFYQLPELLEKGDTLVFNNTRVIPARLVGNSEKEPMEKVTILLLNRKDSYWEALVEVGEVHIGDTISFTGLSGVIISKGEIIGKRKETLVSIILSNEEALDKAGEPPVPPYIHGFKGDPERYQTVYSKIKGSAAAPTAGLHFTDGLLDNLRQMDVNLCFVTLHVGIDTFMPVYEEDPVEHKMYTEFCVCPQEVADVINETRRRGKKVIGVGTTSVRTLESSWSYRLNKVVDYRDWTSIYILPGYSFHSVDCMITNFHYPKSTNLMMVAAFAGLDNIKKAYQEAVDKGYRFYSFGDSMLML